MEGKNMDESKCTSRFEKMAQERVKWLANLEQRFYYFTWD